MSSGPGNILIRIGAETAQAVRDIGKVNTSLGDTMSTSQKATAGIKKAALPAAAALGAIGFAAIDATKAALEDAAAADKLSGQLKRVTGATDDQIASAEDYITKMSLQTGVADDDLRPALGKLATATGSVTSAQDELQLALDISAQTGKSLDTVTTALAKAHSGSTAALGKLVPGLDKATLATKDMHKITDELATLTEGAAADSAKTAAGRYKVWQIQMQELKETLGASLIPVVEELGKILQKVTGFAAEHTTAIKILVGVVAGLAGGIIALNAALKIYEAVQIAVKGATVAWTAMQWLLNAALDANPIGIVVLAIGALGGALVLAYKKSETFRDIVDAALGVVKDAAQKVDLAFTGLKDAALVAYNFVESHWRLAMFAFGPIKEIVQGIDLAFTGLKDAALVAYNWITAHWQLALFAFGPVGAAVSLIASNFDSIKAAAEGAYNWIRDNFKVATGGIVASIDAVTRAFRRITGAIESIIGAIENLIGWISKIHFPHVPGWVPGIGGHSTSSSAASRGATTAATAGGMTINVYGALDPEGTARAIRRVLYASDRRQGLAR